MASVGTGTCVQEKEKDGGEAEAAAAEGTSFVQGIHSHPTMPV